MVKQCLVDCCVIVFFIVKVKLFCFVIISIDFNLDFLQNPLPVIKQWKKIWTMYLRIIYNKLQQFVVPVNELSIDEAWTSKKYVIEWLLVKNFFVILILNFFILDIIHNDKRHVIEGHEKSFVLKDPIVVFAIDFASSISVKLVSVEFIFVWIKPIFFERICIGFASLSYHVDWVTLNDEWMAFIVPDNIIVSI